MKQSDSPTNAVNNMETDVSNKLSPGFKFPFDNFDIRQNVRNMTEENQNKDLHWVNHNAVKNRVSGNHLPNNVPICDITEHLEKQNMITILIYGSDLHKNV